MLWAEYEVLKNRIVIERRVQVPGSTTIWFGEGGAPPDAEWTVERKPVRRMWVEVDQQRVGVAYAGPFQSRVVVLPVGLPERVAKMVIDRMDGRAHDLSPEWRLCDLTDLGCQAWVRSDGKVIQIVPESLPDDARYDESIRRTDTRSPLEQGRVVPDGD